MDRQQVQQRAKNTTVSQSEEGHDSKETTPTDDSEYQASDEEETDESSSPTSQSSMKSEHSDTVPESAPSSADFEEWLDTYEIHGLFQDNSIVDDDGVLEMAGRFKVSEIVHQLNAGKSIPSHSSHQVWRRICLGVDRMALRKGKTVAQISDELREQQRANGVVSS